MAGGCWCFSALLDSQCISVSGFNLLAWPWHLSTTPSTSGHCNLRHQAIQGLISFMFWDIVSSAKWLISLKTSFVYKSRHWRVAGSGSHLRQFTGLARESQSDSFVISMPLYSRLQKPALAHIPHRPANGYMTMLSPTAWHSQNTCHRWLLDKLSCLAVAGGLGRNNTNFVHCPCQKNKRHVVGVVPWERMRVHLLPYQPH